MSSDSPIAAEGGTARRRAADDSDSGIELRGSSPAVKAAPAAPAGGCDSLAEHVGAGRQLILVAALVGDQDDFSTWSRRCGAWTASLAAMMSSVYGHQAAHTFQSATLPASRLGSWEEVLLAEQDRLTETIEMLDELAAERR